jgi:UDPglucose 6-dehydrogenase
MERNNMARIAIIGSGFVGRQVGRGLASLGHEVIFYDPVEKNLPGFTRDINRAIQKSQVSFVCVPTPTIDSNIDLQYIKEAAKNVGTALASQQGYHVVVIKSTVVPTTTDEIVIPALEKYSGKKPGEFGVCVNPEFLTEIESSWTEDERYKRDFLAEDRIVIGEYDKRSGDVLEELYKPLKKPVFRVDLRTAEMIKYASNCMLATRISYWNEIFLICSKLGVNSQEVADIVSMDPRIGRYGAVHGKAFGGKCLPKDLKAFISLAKKHHPARLLQAADDVNEEMKKKYGVRE